MKFERFSYPISSKISEGLLEELFNKKCRVLYCSPRPTKQVVKEVEPPRELPSKSQETGVAGSRYEKFMGNNYAL